LLVEDHVPIDRPIYRPVFFWGKPSRKFQEPPLHRLGLVGQHDMFDFSVGPQEIWAKFVWAKKALGALLNYHKLSN